jgi:uracil-DNA glycosylase, family 4
MQAIRDDMLRAAQAFGKTAADMVFGEGLVGARVMLVGEAPGAEETRLSRPFVGRAGKNLDEFLKALSLARTDIYISNVVKFRPYQVSARGTLSNRPPAKEEIACMLPHLLREIQAVAPKVVVTLGNVPLRSLTGDKRIVIGACHAQRIPAAAHAHAYTLFPLYHPASIIYNPALRAVYSQDLEQLKRFLDTIL